MPSPYLLFCRALRLTFAGALFTYALCVAQEAKESESKPTASTTDEGELTPHKIFPLSKIKENVIGEVTAGSKVAWARSTENHLAWAEKAKNGSQIVRLDGKPGRNNLRRREVPRFQRRPGTPDLEREARIEVAGGHRR